MHFKISIDLNLGEYYKLLKHVPDKTSWKTKSLFPFWNLPKNNGLLDNAKLLRKVGNLSEVIFWKNFNDKQILGFDIDRQVIIGNYIVDFFIPELGLVIEIDGESHDFKGKYDNDREYYLKSLGLEVIHYNDKDIKKSINMVCDSLQLVIKKRVVELKSQL